MLKIIIGINTKLWGPFKITLDSVGACTQNYVGATNIALDSVGAVDIALDSVGAADIDFDSVGAITIARDYAGSMGSSFVLLSGQYSSLLVRSGRSILTTQFYRGPLQSRSLLSWYAHASRRWHLTNKKNSAQNRTPGFNKPNKRPRPIAATSSTRQRHQMLRKPLPVDTEPVL